MFCHQVTKATQRSLQQKTVDFTPESDIEWNPKKKKRKNEIQRSSLKHSDKTNNSDLAFENSTGRIWDQNLLKDKK